MIDFLKIFKSNNTVDEIINLYNNGVLNDILPELIALDENVIGHKNNFKHTIQVLKNVCENNYDYKLKLVALLHDIGKPQSKKINKKGVWTFHNHENIGAEISKIILTRLNITDQYLIDYVYRMIYFHGRTKIHRDVSESAIRRLTKEIGEDIIFDHINFCKCDITTSFPDKRQRIISNLDTIQNRIIEIKKIDDDAKWRSPLTGDIIMNLLNIEPSKIIGDIKKIYDPLFKNNKITLEEAKIEIINKYKNS
jgi:tRNA nucleotidyltransferase (CCA-adding enzyme)